MTLQFNNSAQWHQQAKTQPLTQFQENEVVEIMNTLLLKANSMAYSTHALLQQFLDNYSRLKHGKEAADKNIVISIDKIIGAINITSRSPQSGVVAVELQLKETLKKLIDSLEPFKQ